MKENKQGVKFDSKIRKFGGSYYILLKPSARDYLEVRDGSNIKLQTEHGEYGSYLSVWNPSTQEEKSGDE